jgi:hypothetical protein
MSPYVYPRNPSGAGFLIEATPEAVETLRLPQLEDPEDLLTPDHLASGSTGRWPLMPLPQGFDWVDPGSFPRSAYWGILPPYDALEKPIAEVARGYAPADLMKEGPVLEKFSFRVANGAPLGLQLPYLRGDEECLLVNLHPRHPQFAFRLPGFRPKLSTDGRNGKLKKTDVVLHTVVIEPDESRISMVWRGSAPALRPYLPQELETMPFGVDW